MNIYDAETALRLHEAEMNRQLQKHLAISEAKKQLKTEKQPKTEKHFNFFSRIFGGAKKETKTYQSQ